MNPRSTCRLAAVALLMSGPTFAEKTVPRKDLPPAVEKTLAREMVGATLKGISSEACEGKTKGTCFEVETTRGKESRDLIIDASGVVLEIEEGLPLAEVPDAVRLSAARLGSVLKAERVTRETVVSYELVTEKAGKKSDHAFLPDGTPKK